MKTVRMVFRTVLAAVLLVVCILIGIHSHNIEDKNRNIHSSLQPGIKVDRSNSTSEPIYSAIVGRDHGGIHSQNYVRIADLRRQPRDSYRSKLSNVAGDAVTRAAFDVTTSVTMSTLSSSLSPSGSHNVNTFRVHPYNYTRSMTPSHHVTSLQEHEQSSNLDIRVGVLLPFSGNRGFIVKRVAPAIEKAVDKLATDMGPWNFHSLTVLYADSKCDIAEAMNQAIQLEERHNTLAFFGPVCDYAIAPVARQARYWNTPIITAGATAIDFYWYKNSTYSTLTRIGPANLQGCTEFIEQIILRHNWRKFKILYDSTGQDDNLVAFSHLLVEYLHYHLLTVQSSVEMDFYKLDRGGSGDAGYAMRTEVSADYSEFGIPLLQDRTCWALFKSRHKLRLLIHDHQLVVLHRYPGCDTCNDICYQGALHGDHSRV